jgi:DNA polymerase/3'-5' exonuclease PolX
MQLAQAQKIAIALCYQLQPHCNKLNIAGSVRRKQSQVKDIEIVCSPIKLPSGQADLFAGAVEEAVPKIFEELVHSFGTVELGKPNGRYMKIMLPEQVKLDLFMPQEQDFYRQLAIRTGSSLYSSMVIAPAWKKKGWCGTEHGLRKIIDCKQVDDHKWKLVNPNGEQPPWWTSEHEFFNWIGVKWVEPYQREVQSTSAKNQEKTLYKLDQ